jgi:subtilase family serine protease
MCFGGGAIVLPSLHAATFFLLIFTSSFLAMHEKSIAQAAQIPLQVLHNHVRPAVSNGQAALVGSLPSTQQLNLSIVLPLRNEAALDTLLDQLYDPSSPKYRQFLSVDQFTDQFVPTVEDYQAVVHFAQANGFTVTDDPPNRLIVPIQGTAAQIEKAFNVKMNLYQHPTENRIFFSPDREPSLALSVPLGHIAGLDNYSIPHPMVAQAPLGMGSANAEGSGPGGSYLASDMRAAYYGGSALTGSGQTVGIFEYGGYNISDVVSSFNGKASVTTNGTNYTLSYLTGGVNNNIAINNVFVDGGTLTPVPLATCSNCEAEDVLDIVQPIGMAPGLNQVRVYIAPYSNTSYDADIFNRMATDNPLAKQISVSWGWRPEDHTQDRPIFQEMAAQGQSIFVASGDSGAYTGSNSYDESYPAEDPYVIAVGGTDLTTSGPGGSWVSETAWSDSSGGPSDDLFIIPSPDYQAGLYGVNGASTVYRNVPDVAMEADKDNYNCVMGSCADWGGTSYAAPRWAGFMALVNQQAVAAGQSTLGFINPAIYPIGESSNYGCDFHDITSGSNGKYSAGPGYDLVTGWGSPNGQYFINSLISGVGCQTATPYESNVTVTLNGNPPSSITYAMTVQDDTPDATIYYEILVDGAVVVPLTSIRPGGTIYFNASGFQSPYGTMYATAPGILQSSTIGLGF